MRNLFEDAAEALERALRRDVWFGDREPGPATSLGPALMAQRLAGVLEIPCDQVTVHHDATRARLGPLAVVFEVPVEARCAPVDQTVPPLRFAPIPGHETDAFFLRGHCFDCDCEAPDAAVAVITCLADLGYYLHLGRGPRTVFWELITHDTGHTGLCVWRHPTTRALAALGRGITDPPRPRRPGSRPRCARRVRPTAGAARHRRSPAMTGQQPRRIDWRPEMTLIDRAADGLAIALHQDPRFGERPPALPPTPTPAVMAQALADLLRTEVGRIEIRRDEARPTKPLPVLFRVPTGEQVEGLPDAPVSLRFAPIKGHETEAFFLRGYCEYCSAPDAEVAVITCLADLGYYLENRHAPHNSAQSMIFRQLGHSPDCLWAGRATYRDRIHRERLHREHLQVRIDRDRTAGTSTGQLGGPNGAARSVGAEAEDQTGDQRP